VFGDRLAADHDADVVRDVPTPDTDLILALHPEMFGFAQVYKSMYPDATLVCLVWDVKKWLMYDPAFNPLFEITRAGLEMADVVWVPTEDVAEAVKDAFGAEAKVMPFWFNPLRRRRKASDGSVVFVGRFERHKRHDRILRELAGMNGDRPRVKLIGRNGETVEWLKELVKTLDVDVDFMVDATDEQMADAVVRAEAFINPSEHDGDGGQAVLQAHALGIPIKRTIQGEPYRPPQTLTGIKSATNRFMASFQQEGWL